MSNNLFREAAKVTVNLPGLKEKEWWLRQLNSLSYSLTDSWSTYAPDFFLQGDKPKPLILFLQLNFICNIDKIFCTHDFSIGVCTLQSGIFPHNVVLNFAYLQLYNPLSCCDILTWPFSTIKNSWFINIWYIDIRII